jgi:hypothetical protein
MALQACELLCLSSWQAAKHTPTRWKSQTCSFLSPPSSVRVSWDMGLVIVLQLPTGIPKPYLEQRSHVTNCV